MVLKYFKKVEHTALESEQASGLDKVEENEVEKQLQSIRKQQSKTKRQHYSNYDKIQLAEIANWGIAHGVTLAVRKFCILSQWYTELSGTIK